MEPWTCPTCKRGVAPGVEYCSHGNPGSAPEGYALIKLPELAPDLSRETALIRTNADLTITSWNGPIGKDGNPYIGQGGTSVVTNPPPAPFTWN